MRKIIRSLLSVVFSLIIFTLPLQANTFQYSARIKSDVGALLPGTIVVFGVYQDNGTAQGTLIQETKVSAGGYLPAPIFVPPVSDALVTFDITIPGNFYVETKIMKTGYVGNYEIYAVSQNRIISIDVSLKTPPWNCYFTGWIGDEVHNGVVDYYMNAMPTADFLAATNWHNTTPKLSDLGSRDFVMGSPTFNGSYRSDVTSGDWTLFYTPSTNGTSWTVVSSDAHVFPGANYFEFCSFGTIYVDLHPSVNTFYEYTSVVGLMTNTTIVLDFYSLSQNTLIKESIITYNNYAVFVSQTDITGNYYVEASIKTPGRTDYFAGYIVTQDKYIAQTVFSNVGSDTITGIIGDNIGRPLPNYSVSMVITRNAADYTNWQTSRQYEVGVFPELTVTTDINGVYSANVPYYDYLYVPPYGNIFNLEWTVKSSVTKNWLTGVVISNNAYPNPTADLGLTIMTNVDSNPGLTEFRFTLLSARNRWATLIPSINVIAETFSVTGNLLHSYNFVSSTNGQVDFVVSENTAYGVQILLFDAITSDLLQGQALYYAVTADRWAQTSLLLADAPYTITGTIMLNQMQPLPTINVFSYPLADLTALRSWFASPSVDLFTNVALGSSDQNGAYSLQIAAGVWAFFISDTVATMNQSPITINAGVNVPPFAGPLNFIFSNSFVYKATITDQLSAPISGAMVNFGFYKWSGSSRQLVQEQTIYSDLTGMVSITPSILGTYNMEVKVAANNYLGKILGYSVSQNRIINTIIPLTTSTVAMTGNINDDFNKPVPGYSATALTNTDLNALNNWRSSMNQQSDLSMLSLATTVTDINGIYNLNVLPNTWYVYISPSLNSSQTTIVSSSAQISGTTGLGQINLNLYPTLNVMVYQGTIINGASAPVPSATIYLDIYNENGGAPVFISEQILTTDSLGRFAMTLSPDNLYSAELRIIASGYVGVRLGYSVKQDRLLFQTITLNQATLTVNSQLLDDLANGLVNYAVYGYGASDLPAIIDWHVSANKQTDMGIFNMALAATDPNGMYDLGLITGNWSVFYASSINSNLVTINPLISVPPVNSLPITAVNTHPGLSGFVMTLFGYNETGTTLNNLNVITKIYSSSGAFIGRYDYVSSPNGKVQIILAAGAAYGVETMVFDGVNSDLCAGNVSYFSVTSDRMFQKSVTLSSAPYQISGYIMAPLFNFLSNVNVFAYPTANLTTIQNWYSNPVSDFTTDLATALSGQNGLYSLQVPTGDWAVFYSDTLTTMNQAPITLTPSVIVPPSAMWISSPSANLFFGHTYTATSDYILVAAPFGIISSDASGLAWVNSGNTGQYVSISLNTIQPGMAVWAIISSDISISPATSSYVIGPKTVHLTPGFNLIANPQVITIDWANVLVSYNNQTYSVMAAATQNLIQSGLCYYDGTKYILTDIVIPWKGYWVNAIQPIDLIFPATNTYVTPNNPGGLLLITKELQLGLNFDQDNSGSDYLTLAADDETLDFRSTALTPAQPSSSLRVYGLNNNNQLMVDRVPYDNNNMEWNVQVNTQKAGNINITLAEQKNTLLTHFNYFLVDVRNGKSTTIKNGVAGMAVYPGLNLITIRAVNASSTGTLQSLINWPNPFNPINPGEVSHIDYVLTAGSSIEATVKIYSLTGKLIRGLHASNLSLSGSLTWDGRDDNGMMMPNDIYFYIINLKDSTGSEIKAKGKIVLWKK
ncbi:MAG: hypothetical protein PHV30_01490 [Candidatus Margulisbacteria bacterium]|nr:hypothetical protein [Candidatus Margulisiibacteriota bacterium]